jgi:hypothetical protein
MTDTDKAKLRVIYVALAAGFDREICALGALHDIAVRDPEGYSAGDAEVLSCARENLSGVRKALCVLFEAKLK